MYIHVTHVCVIFIEGEDKMSHYCIIVLGVSTLGASVLLWWIYKYFSGKNKYDVEGTYLYLFIVSCTYVQPNQFEIISMYVLYIAQVHTYKVMW